MTENFDDDAVRGAYRLMSETYARSADHGPGEAMAAIFAADGQVISPGATLAGRDAISSIPAKLREMFAATRHEVLNQTIVGDGDNRAFGETYCNAHHLLHETGAGQRQVLVWRIRYQDQLRREHGAWYLVKRELVLDWTETREVKL